MRRCAGIVCLVVFLAAAATGSTERLPVRSLALGDATADLVFTPMTPCRIVDTRLAGGILTAGTTRSFKVRGTGGFDAQGGMTGGCGVPPEASAVLINFVAVDPAGIGNLKGSAYPNPIPAVGSLINYQKLDPTLNVANAVVVPICNPALSDCSYDLTLLANGSATQVVADVLGHFHRIATEQLITAITPGSGLTGGGTSGVVSLAANFTPAGVMNGTATTVARGDHRHYVRTIVVSPVPGGSAWQNGAALRTALDGIVDSSATNPYLLKLEPGVYNVGSTPLAMKPGVDLEGSGQLRTRVLSDFSSATITLVDGAVEIRSVAIGSAGTDTISPAIYSTAQPDLRLYDVTVTTSSGSGIVVSSGPSGSPVVLLDRCTVHANLERFFTHGLLVSGATASVTIRNSWIEAVNSGAGSQAFGVRVGGNTTALTIENSTIRAAAEYVIEALDFSNGDLNIRSSSFQATTPVVAAGGEIHGITLSAARVHISGSEIETVHPAELSSDGIYDNSSTVSITGTRISVASGYGVDAWGGPDSVSIENSQIFATNPVYSGAANTVRIAGSRLAGGNVVNGAKCAGNWDEDFAFYASTCPQ